MLQKLAKVFKSLQKFAKTCSFLHRHEHSIWKGDPMECRSYREIKLLEHAMKMVERIFEHRIRQQIDVDDMQFGFMKGKGTTSTIFIVVQMQEKFRAEEKKLYLGFVDLEKAFDGVPREVIRWAMRKLGVEEWLISAVMFMYTGAKTWRERKKTVRHVN